MHKGYKLYVKHFKTYRNGAQSKTICLRINSIRTCNGSADLKVPCKTYSSGKRILIKQYSYLFSIEQAIVRNVQSFDHLIGISFRLLHNQHIELLNVAIFTSKKQFKKQSQSYEFLLLDKEKYV
uniref:Uncharacterized protein n=1 Tax=Romanomermis culicivorax TaxID=13658 RepID=A0A915HK23_ROMCU